MNDLSLSEHRIHLWMLSVLILCYYFRYLMNEKYHCCNTQLDDKHHYHSSHTVLRHKTTLVNLHDLHLSNKEQ